MKHSRRIDAAVNEPVKNKVMSEEDSRLYAQGVREPNQSFIKINRLVFKIANTFTFNYLAHFLYSSEHPLSHQTWGHRPLRCSVFPCLSPSFILICFVCLLWFFFSLPHPIQTTPRPPPPKQMCLTAPSTVGTVPWEYVQREGAQARSSSYASNSSTSWVTLSHTGKHTFPHPLCRAFLYRVVLP